MSLEVLLLVTCLTEKDTCNDVGKAYYRSSPVLRQQVRARKKQVEAYTGKQILFIGSIAGTMVARKAFQIRISQNVNLQIKEDEYILNLSRSF